MQRRRMAIQIMIFCCLPAINLWAQNVIPFCQLNQIDANDVHEDIITKAAHIVPSSVQLAYHRNEFIAMICLGPNTYEYWYTLIRELAPEAVIFGKGPDVRWCGNESGRTRESEWNVIPLDVHPDNCDWLDITAEDLGSREKLYDAKYLYYLPAETNTSIRHGWFYRDDTLQDARTADDVFDIYERSVGGNSVFMLNIPPNRDGQFSIRDANVLKEVGKRIRETYGHNLLKDAVSNSTFVLDGDGHACWSPEKEDENLMPTLDEPVTVNRFMIHEAIGLKGQRIEHHAMDAWIDQQWKEVAQGTTVGYKKIMRFPQVTSNRFRLRIPVSRLKPSVTEISAHYYRPRPGILQIQRDSQGFISISPQAKAFEWKPHHQNTALINQDLEIRYTIDGNIPDKKSAGYRNKFLLRSGGVVKARAFSRDEEGQVVTECFGLLKCNWKPISVSSQVPEVHPASNAFDGNPETFWITGEKGERKELPAHPHFISIDIDTACTITGFMYLPRQDNRIPEGMIEKGYIEISEDGKNWQNTENFEFGNLLNDPSRRTCWFRKPVKGRYIRLISTAGVDGNPSAGAAEIEMLTK